MAPRKTAALRWHLISKQNGISADLAVMTSCITSAKLGNAIEKIMHDYALQL
jgi:hypothetical protein